MTLIAEDGTGKIDSESYSSVAEAEAYLALHGGIPSTFVDVKASNKLTINSQPTPQTHAEGTLTVVDQPVGNVKATGAIQFSGETFDGDTATIDGVVYTFRSSVSVAFDVELSSGAGFSAQNLADAVLGLNLSTVGPGTTPHPKVSGARAGNDASLTALNGGVAANSVTLASSGANIGQSGATLTGGSDGDKFTINDIQYELDTNGELSSNPNHIEIGADVATTQSNIFKALTLTGTEGVEYSAGTVSPSDVAFDNPFSGNDLVITASVRGVLGNALVTTSAFTSGNNKFDAGTLGTTTLGVNGDEIQIGSKFYYWHTAPIHNFDGLIPIGGDLATSRQNLCDAIVGDTINNPGLPAATTPDPNVTCLSVDQTSGDLNIEALVGGTTANSVVTVVAASDGLTTFATATLEGGEDNRETALREATQYIDTTFFSKWVGSQGTKEQALNWPRVGAFSKNGFTIDTDEIPQELKTATIEMSVRAITTDIFNVDLTQQGLVIQERKKVASLEKEIHYQSGVVQKKSFQKVNEILKPILKSGGFRTIRA